MKLKLLLPIAAILFVSCTQDKPEKTVGNPKESNFDFLLGNWQRTNDKDGKQTFEHWGKQNDSVYRGHSFTLLEKDTIWQEFVTLSPIDGIWFYQVSMPESDQSTNFKVTEKTNNAFSCENPQNEFPKFIKYSLKGNDLLAEISDEKNMVLFEFVKH